MIRPRQSPCANKPSTPTPEPGISSRVVPRFQLGLIAQTGDIDAALAGFTRIIDAYQASSGDHYTRGGLGYLVEWLARLGYHDGAARLYGASTLGRPEFWADPLPDIVTLAETMGHARLHDRIRSR